MKKKHLYLIGLIITLILSLVLKNYTNDSENANTINIYRIIMESLKPLGALFLMFLLFPQNLKKYKTTLFIITILAYMLLNLTFNYFEGKNIIEYNYIIGTILGLIPILIFDRINKTQNKAEI